MVARLTAPARRTHRQNSTAIDRSSSASSQHGREARWITCANDVPTMVLLGLIPHARNSGPAQQDANRQTSKEDEQGGKAIGRMESGTNGNPGRNGHPERTDHPQNTASKFVSTLEDTSRTYHAGCSTWLSGRETDAENDI